MQRAAQTTCHHLAFARLAPNLAAAFPFLHEWAGGGGPAGIAVERYGRPRQEAAYGPTVRAGGARAGGADTATARGRCALGPNACGGPNENAIGGHTGHACPKSLLPHGFEA